MLFDNMPRRDLPAVVVGPPVVEGPAVEGISVDCVPPSVAADTEGPGDADPGAIDTVVSKSGA